jgi:hypothetical protein
VNNRSSDQSTKVNTYVSGKARYVKIAVVRMHSHASMRGDVLLSKVQAALPPVALAYSTPAQYRKVLQIVHMHALFLTLPSQFFRRALILQQCSSNRFIRWMVSFIFHSVVVVILIYGTGALQAVLQDSWLSISRGS